MFKINVGRLNIKLMSYAVLTIFTAIDLSPTRMLLHPNQPQQGLYSHRFVAPPACFYIPTNLSKVCTAIDLSPHPHAVTSQPTSEGFG